MVDLADLFLSTLSLRRATQICGKLLSDSQISIHALLAESDDTSKDVIKTASNFYPRSPCGERRVTVLGIQHRVGISIHALLAESDRCELGRNNRKIISIHALLAESDITFRQSCGRIPVFLSTLSLRRATRKVPILGIK